MIKRFATTLIRTYQWFVSPWLGARCRFEPSCSRYAEEALHTHGILHGGVLTMRRLLRCHPWGACGHDPVPASTRP